MINGPLVHLVFNHIPVIGVPACVLLLLASVVRKSRDLTGAGLVGLVLVALLSIAAFLSGDSAAGGLREMAKAGTIRPDVLDLRERIERHDDAASIGFWILEALGALALVGLALAWRKGAPPRPLVMAMLVAAVLLSGWFAWIAHLGGLIRHPEIDPGSIRDVHGPA